MKNVGNKWKVAAAIINVGSLGAGGVNGQQVKSVWQKFRGTKSAAASVATVTANIPTPIEAQKLTRNTMIAAFDTAAKRVKAGMGQFEQKILAWNDPEHGISEDVDQQGALRRLTTAIGTVRQLPRFEGESTEYCAALEKLAEFADENKGHIQNLSLNGLRKNASCLYTPETVKGCMEFLGKACELMQEVVQHAPVWAE